MTEQELRALVRDAVARHLGTRAPEPHPQAPLPPFSAAPIVERLSAHPSHGQYLALINVGDACVIEPSVTCNHCGYCRSHGH